MIDQKEALTGILADYFGIDDHDGSYHYTLGRAKEAFAIGTMELDDFHVYDEDTVAEIAAHLIQNGVTVHGVMDGVLVVNPTGREMDAILADIEAGIVSVIPDTEALQMKAERENPEPLTLEELRQMNGEPVWIQRLDSDKAFWMLAYRDVVSNRIGWLDYRDYGTGWTAYRHKPKEAER